VAIDPGVVGWLIVAEALYVRAIRILAARGIAIGRGQQACWHAGIALQALGLLSPIDAFGDRLLAAHMAQHLLIADLAAPLLLAGLRTPVLVFLLPRPVLVALARRRGLRRALRAARRPLPAIAIYAVILYGWHLDFAFTAAVEHPLAHAFQHASFIAAGMLVWWSALEPKRRRLPGELWKIGHLLGARLVGMFLGMAFVLIRVPVYTDAYGAGERALGLDAVGDQQVAGALMVVTDILLMVFVLIFFFVHAAREQDRSDARERAGVA
jgi:putative copper resistance protein D